MPNSFLTDQENDFFNHGLDGDASDTFSTKPSSDDSFAHKNDYFAASDDAWSPPGKDIIVLDTESFAKGNGGSGGGSGGGTEGVLTKYISGDAGGYNIEITFKGTWTSALQQAFIDASEFLSDEIHSDIANVFVRGKIIDDIKIDASLKTIDGEGGILGQAGATSIRTSNYLPATAVMEFDSADANTFNTLGLWKDIVQHEMIHCLGFSAGIWNYMNLVSGVDTSNPLFTGDNAIAAYEALFGAVDASGVPLEQDGGAGTRNSHWDEETFSNELMTGWIDNSNYLSDMTIAALKDMGYDANWV